MSEFGPHLIGDLSGCESSLMLDRKFTARLLIDVCYYVGLTPMGLPHLDEYTGPHEEWKGYSATLHVETSHITAHFFAFGYAFIDIFSCKPFAKDPRSYIEQRVGASAARWQNVERGYLFPPELLEEGGV